MRVLILSEKIRKEHRFGINKFSPPGNIYLHVDEINNTENFNSSIFDYDVSIININIPKHHSIGYFENLPKIMDDTKIALENGRTVIILPESKNFISIKRNQYGLRAYDWLENFGIKLHDNEGTNFVPSGLGKSKAISTFLEHITRYHQIVAESDQKDDEILCRVQDTEIIVGIEHSFGIGKLVVLPPPYYTDILYQQFMLDLMQLSFHYYEKANRKIYIGDSPEWVGNYLPKRALDVISNIETLQKEKGDFDLISYSLYGTGTELESSVSYILTKFGMNVIPQSIGANIDLKATWGKKEKKGFVIEVTGTKGTIKKDSKKIAQAWKYISDRKGTEEESYRIIVIANTQCHLDPNERKLDSFSRDVADLLGKHEVLLITTKQLYDLWKLVVEGKQNPDQIAKKLYNQYGLLKL